MRLMQPVLLFKPPVKSFSTKGTPCLQKVSRLFQSKKYLFKFQVSSYSEAYLVKCSRNLLPSFSSAASIARFRQFFRHSVNLTNSF